LVDARENAQPQPERWIALGIQGCRTPEYFDPNDGLFDLASFLLNYYYRKAASMHEEGVPRQIDQQTCGWCLRLPGASSANAASLAFRRIGSLSEDTEDRIGLGAPVRLNFGRFFFGHEKNTRDRYRDYAAEGDQPVSELTGPEFLAALQALIALHANCPSSQVPDSQRVRVS
jgi:hypothetical protein